MIIVKNLAKSYKSIKALDDISFSVEKGEIFGFLGPNGAGKSTTIRLLTCQIFPTSGEGYVCGFNIVKERKEIKKQIGVVFEYQNLYTRLSGKVNLEVFRKLYRLPGERVDEVLELVGLLNRAKEPVKNYSRGMKQRLLIARALLHKPKVLFLDEPTSGLDPHSAKEIRTMIKDLSSEGITVFLTSHYLEEAENLCNRIAIIEKGKIIALDKTENLKSCYSSNEIKLKIKEGDLVKDVTLSLNEKESLKKLSDYWGKEGILSIHTVEPNLEEVFLSITNSGEL